MTAGGPSQVLPVAAGLLVLLAAGCRSIGPATIPRDRLDYSESIAASWKNQLLRNLVKLRYLDTPIFLDVAQIVSGYTLETGISVGGQFSPQNLRGDTFASAGVQGTFTDRPTITYTPLTGDKFLRSIIDPVPPRSLLYLMQSGYAADFLLALGADSVNGLRNRSFQAGKVRSADPGFVRLLDLMRGIQEAGGIGVQADGSTNREPAFALFFREENMPEEVLAQIQEVKHLLRLAEGVQRFPVLYSPTRGTAQQLTVGSRSVLQVLTALATFVDVPKEDVEQGRAVPVPETMLWGDRLFHVHCGASKPEDAFVAVDYRKHWFWIDDRDWRSKRTMTTILFLFTLSGVESGERLPLLTIPAG